MPGYCEHLVIRPSIQLHDALAIGWIPHRAWLGGIKNPAYGKYLKRKGWRFWLILHGLFGTGNGAPSDEVFRTREAFMGYLKTKEYRGAAGGFDTVVQFSNDGRPIARILSQLPAYYRIGFTPKWIPIPRIYRWMRTFFKCSYDYGVGRTDGPHARLSVDGKMIDVDYTVWFRLGDQLRSMVKKHTGFEPPYLGMVFHYEIDLEAEEAAVYLHGTPMPSQLAYHCHPAHGVRRVQFHDMLEISEPEIRSVLECMDEDALITIRRGAGVRFRFSHLSGETF
jgi:hypothetical protein